MPRAEAGTTKAISKQIKQKGLTRLRWYCQVCEKACRDENAFKQHTLSESHVRQMQVVGQNSHKVINDYSRQFQHDFVQLLRTSHGEKRVNINHFYNSYIQDRHHIHQNATKWHSLTDFAKHLGREGICRVDEEDPGEKGGRGGLFIAWIDNSPEAMRRQEALKKRDRQDRGDEEREQALIRAQIKRARLDKGLEKGLDDDSGSGNEDNDDDEEREKARELRRDEGTEKIRLNFVPKSSTSVPAQKNPPPSQQDHTSPTKPEPSTDPIPPPSTTPADDPTGSTTTKSPNPPSSTNKPPISLTPTATTSNNTNTKPTTIKNVFSSTAKPKKTNPLAAASKKSSSSTTQNLPFGSGQDNKKPMSQAERIMKEELERKRLRDERLSGNGKKRF